MVETQNNIFIPSYNFENIVIDEMLNNKLFCTFIEHDKIQETIDILTNRYSILYGKIFILESPDTNELILTYNIDVVNTVSRNALPNTILLHRRKEFNCLYSLNALNEIVKSLNNGVIDPNYKVNWADYRNSVLLTQDGLLRQIHTKIYTIVEL